MRVGKASLSEDDDNLDIGEVGRPASGTLLIGTSAGSLRIEQIQKPGGKMLPTSEFLRGYDLPEGTMLLSENAASLLLQRGKTKINKRFLDSHSGWSILAIGGYDVDKIAF